MKKVTISAIRKEIIEIVENEAKELISQATNKAEEINAETDEKIREMTNRTQKESENMIKQLKNLKDAQAKFEVKKIELQSKKEIIRRIFEKTESKIRYLNESTLEKITEILLKNASNQIDIDFIICNERTKKWIPKKIKVETAEMLGGIIAENNDRTLRIDNSFETIIEDVRKDALKEIVEGVF